MRPLRGTESLFSFWQEQDEYADAGQARGTTEGDAGSTPAVGSISKRLREDATEFHVAVSDIHFPEHDEPAVVATLRFIEDMQPDLICLVGDVGEFESMSQHGKAPSQKALREDIDAVRWGLERFREAAPDAAIHFVMGNHETRVERAIHAFAPALDGMIDLGRELDLESLGIVRHPYGSVLQSGPVAFTHGHFHGLHHAKKHMDHFAFDGVLFVGHTHRPQARVEGRLRPVDRKQGPQAFLQGIGDGAKATYCLPCLRTLDPAWADGHPFGWLHGFGCASVINGKPVPFIIPMTSERKFAWGGQVYGP